jgi:hypothetical protein
VRVGAGSGTGRVCGAGVRQRQHHPHAARARRTCRGSVQCSAQHRRTPHGTAVGCGVVGDPGLAPASSGGSVSCVVQQQRSTRATGHRCAGVWAGDGLQVCCRRCEARASPGVAHTRTSLSRQAWCRAHASAALCRRVAGSGARQGWGAWHPAGSSGQRTSSNTPHKGTCKQHGSSMPAPAAAAVPPQSSLPGPSPACPALPCPPPHPPSPPSFTTPLHYPHAEHMHVAACPNLSARHRTERVSSAALGRCRRSIGVTQLPTAAPW